MHTAVDRYRDGGTTVFTNEKQSFVLSTSLCAKPNQFYFGTSPYLPEEMNQHKEDLELIISILEESENPNVFAQNCIVQTLEHAKTMLAEL